MSVMDDDLGGTNSFWELENYKRTVKRSEDGAKLCDELMKLIRERATIEKEYASKLRSWSKAWSDRIDKGPEYGTTASAWKGVLTEADRMADIHLQIKENLIDKVEKEVAIWKKENFKKSALGSSKETKTLETDFGKAQKPWAKKYTKLLKARKDYHAACRAEKSSVNQENNARADSAVSPDNLKKLQDKVEKNRKEVESTKNKYEAALSDLNGYNAKYMEDMTDVFNSAQEREAKRLTHFKEMLFGVHKCLDISQNALIPDIYAQYHATIDQADYEKDLKWWSLHHGVDMPMNWPVFEEYSEEFHDISSRRRGKDVSGVEGVVMLKRINLDKHNEEFPEYSPELNTISRKEKKSTHNDGVTITNIKKNRDSTYDDYNDRNDATMSHQPPPSAGSQASDKNPFGEEDDWGQDGVQEYDNPLDDDGAEGAPVRALYDYEGAEDDELTFKTGDVFVKLRDRDDQGWCKGRKDGTVGLFPDNYVESIST